MGSCVSSHLRKSRAPTSNVADIPSPVKDTAVNGGGVVLKSQWSVSQSTVTVHDYGSKEEVFFDSRAWIDSDAEDDFFSVKGDFTPSRGSTPVHPSLLGIPRVNGTPTIDIEKVAAAFPELSPATRKKKLAELFRESFGGADEAPFVANDDKPEVSPEKNPSKPPAIDVLPNPERGTPRLSGANSFCKSETATDGPDEEEKPDGPVQQRCLPSLMSCRISMDRKKKMSPAIVV